MCLDLLCLHNTVCVWVCAYLCKHMFLYVHAVSIQMYFCITIPCPSVYLCFHVWMFVCWWQVLMVTGTLRLLLLSWFHPSVSYFFQTLNLLITSCLSLHFPSPPPSLHAPFSLKRVQTFGTNRTEQWVETPKYTNIAWVVRCGEGGWRKLSGLNRGWIVSQRECVCEETSPVSRDLP